MADDTHTITVTVLESRRTPEGIELEYRAGSHVSTEFLPRATLIGHGRKQYPDATEEEVAAAVDAYLAKPLDGDEVREGRAREVM